MEGSEPLPEIKFGLNELAGSVGDFGTILPLVLAVSAVAGLSLGYILLFFGIWFIITGYYYRIPVPIEPMKVIAVVAIAENMSAGQIAAAGLILGLLFFALGHGKWLDVLENYIPRSVIRGIQLGLALLLVRTSIGFVAGDLVVFGLAITIMAGVYVVSRAIAVPDLSAVILIGVAFGTGVVLHGFPAMALLPLPHLFLPSPGDIPAALGTLVVPQGLLTITNAILATSLLSRDLFGQALKPARLSRTIGLMNLTTVPFGGFPMCHGAGGMAGQYRFGARTGGANIYAGIFFLLLAFLFACPDVLSLVSDGVYATLLVFVAIELGRHGIKTESYLVTGLIAALSVLVNMTLAFAAGMCLAYGIRYLNKRGRKNTKDQ
ncbi:MAG: hypothetical protein A4E40_01428 [Methanoregulaceae archaeon PtaU1.Bin059]|jgi:hypothetical protein|nr:MAG: hypothetical protein A4E40_01428 [Methanoregulaceae archaeon PtaU1.Bin059]